MSTEEDPAELSARVALSHLSGIGPARLRWLLDEGTANDAIDRLRKGGVPAAQPPRALGHDTLDTWRREALAMDADALLDRHLDAGLSVMGPGHRAWPFGHDPDPPIVVFVWGRVEALTPEAAVSVVGTRRCTDIGRGFAFDIGKVLAESGVTVVSGLALGIDGAAHRGVMAAQRPSGGPGWPVAVVANGLDQVSPRSHRTLTEAVAADGAVVSETPLRTQINRWRFAARNRLIVALGHTVVVVESHARGGALITAELAMERDVGVMAVPGSIRSSASQGTNRLLVDGATPLCSIDDLRSLLALGPAGSVGKQGEPAQASLVFADPLEAAVMAEVGTGPVSIDRLVASMACSLDDMVVAIHRLVASGAVRQVGFTVSLPTS